MERVLKRRSLLLEVGKGTTVVVTIPNILLKETDNVTAFRVRATHVNVEQWRCCHL